MMDSKNLEEIMRLAEQHAADKVAEAKEQIASMLFEASQNLNGLLPKIDELMKSIEQTLKKIENARKAD